MRIREEEAYRVQTTEEDDREGATVTCAHCSVLTALTALRLITVGNHAVNVT